MLLGIRNDPKRPFVAVLGGAVADALPEGAAIDMPATPERVWRAAHQHAL